MRLQLKICSFIFLYISIIFYSVLMKAQALPSLSSLEQKIELGERLFLEERFSYSFYVHAKSYFNVKTQYSDPALNWGEPIKNSDNKAAMGQHYSCSTCHLVDQMSDLPIKLVFTYNDPFARSPQPYRFKRNSFTHRNSMNMVASMIHADQPLHWDGEYFSAEELTCDGLTGRNLGWALDEYGMAVAHIASVIKADNGQYDSQQSALAYRQVFAQLGVNVTESSDSDILKSVCEMISHYMKDIDFSKDSFGRYQGSAYDQFLIKNNIASSPSLNESNEQYSQRVLQQLKTSQSLKTVAVSPLSFHSSSSKFGPKEIEGMKLFFGKANCVKCHQPPLFTDSGFHNIGISQLDYEKVHGKNTFNQLEIPSSFQRKAEQNKFMIPTKKAPYRLGVFRQFPNKNHLGQADLGAWNILLHPEKLHVQKPLKKQICQSLDLDSMCEEWSDDIWLSRSIGLFKTPTLRSLGQSAPYFHSGSSSTLHSVLATYLSLSRKAKKKELRNIDSRILSMQLAPKDFIYLEAFLNSLNEDYD